MNAQPHLVTVRTAVTTALKGTDITADVTEGGAVITFYGVPQDGHGDYGAWEEATREIFADLCLAGLRVNDAFFEGVTEVWTIEAV
jgi:hypothetical protein